MILDQARLNIEDRNRTSRLPWRGQFSPDLIDYLMDEVCPDSRSFFDPFCGSGTVLFEAVERGHEAWGIEVNPAAWHLSSLAAFPRYSSQLKKEVFKRIKDRLSDSLSFFTQADVPDQLDLLSDIKSGRLSDIEALVLSASLILGTGNGKTLTSEAIRKGLFAVSSLIHDLLKFSGRATTVLGDARDPHLVEGSVDAVITSPPYINVFNYHQNYRPVTELLGWNPLEAARVEIGANRKFRQNRFLTVVQYCLDMSLALSEMARALKAGAPLVIILGRTSNVLECSFRNGEIVKSVIDSTECFGPVKQAERVFTNRYGEKIFEDILITEKRAFSTPDLYAAREIGKAALITGLSKVNEKNKLTLNLAIEQALDVAPSGKLELKVPSYFVTQTEVGHGSGSDRRAR